MLGDLVSQLLGEFGAQLSPSREQDIEVVGPFVQRIGDQSTALFTLLALGHYDAIAPSA